MPTADGHAWKRLGAWLKKAAIFFFAVSFICPVGPLQVVRASANAMLYVVARPIWVLVVHEIHQEHRNAARFVIMHRVALSSSADTCRNIG